VADSSWRTRPWANVIAPGIFATPKRDVWLYRSFPVAPLEWEDPPARLDFQSKLERLLVEIGESSRDLGQGVRALAQNRSIHVLTVHYEEASDIPADTPPKLADFQRRVLFDQVPKKVLVVGVKLRRDAVAALTNTDTDDSLLKRAKKAFKSVGSAPTDMSLFARDFERMNAIFSRAGGTEPTKEHMAQLTSWFSNGAGVDIVLSAASTRFALPTGQTWQISALMGTDEFGMEMTSPNSTWLMDAMNHPEGARVVSVRSELEPATVTRGRLRHMQRVLANQEEEERATGDIGRDEISEKKNMAKAVENYTRTAGHAWLTKTSVLFAREIVNRDPDETFIDMLSSVYGMDVKVLEKRQLKALSEMLPGSDDRVNPFPQDVNPAWLAYSGVSGFGAVGDPWGLLLGSADPQWTNVFIDEYAAANRNKPPIMGIFGEPGSGKAQPLDAHILTPGGWVTMGSLNVGDEITGSDGGSTAVTGVFPQGNKNIYTLTLSDGTQARACEDHLWTVRTAGGQWETRDVKAMREGLAKGETLAWEIPVMGSYRGGDSSAGMDVFAKGASLSTTGEIGTLRDEYRNAGHLQRIALMAGLLSSAHVTFSQGWATAQLETTNNAEIIAHIVRSLGGVCEKFEGTVLTFTIPGPWFTYPEPCTNWAPARRYITSIEPSSSEAAQCISVSAEDNLYVTNDFILTHNTFAAQLLTAQAALGGQSAIFINPKGFDSLKDFAAWVGEAGAPSRVISMQAMEEAGGAFDPFRFVEPKMAAEILARHINTVLGVTYAGGLTGKQEVELGRGLSEGAMAGAGCAMGALQYVRDKDVIEQVTSMVEASTLFGLAFGNRPQEPWGAASGLTLIEFDREMPLPTPGKDYAHFERDERIAVAALRLVSRASLEILMRSNGGVLVVDEAHHFLSSSEGLATLERIGREGRSLGLLPIFATQRVTDLLKVDMESFMSRVLALKLSDPREGEAALRLCRLEATPGRLNFLAQASAGLGFFRDLDDRHSLIQCGAGVPEDLRMAMSTNRADRLVKKSLLEAAENVE
jgi:hypothetical protein